MKDIPQFDYQSAWLEVAKPGFASLPKCIHNLVTETYRVACDLVQEKDTLRMPVTEAVQEYILNPMENVPTSVLARASNLVYHFGHWGYTPEGRAIQVGGTYWKFAKYADHSLKKRLVAPHPMTTLDSTVNTKLIDGMLRVTWDSNDAWLWEEVGLATQDNYDVLEAHMRDLIMEEFKFKEKALVLREQLWPKDEYLGRLRDPKAYIR